jgi:alkyl sulfatase BDS1-like metallo-beta-lactamase superfamily hydrolase
MPSAFMPVITSNPANPADSSPEKIISTPFRKVVIDGVEFDFEPAPKTLQQIQVAT